QPYGAFRVPPGHVERRLVDVEGQFDRAARRQRQSFHAEMLEESLQVRVPDGEVEACTAVEPTLGREDLAGQAAIFDFAVDDVDAGPPRCAHDAERRSAKREGAE